MTILDISSIISLFTITEPINDCSASKFEGSFFSMLFDSIQSRVASGDLQEELTGTKRPPILCL